jgi:ABC-type transport system involved in cytochrome bd biosynthesis fused ATPase/permease subunit
MNMTRSKKYSLTAVLSLMILAACGGGVGGDAAAQLGQAFAQAFRATDTAEPVEPGAIMFQGVSDSDVARLATLEPVNF